MRVVEPLSRRVFYGWVVTVLCLLVTTTAFGVLYSFGIFFKSWLAEWQSPRALLSAVFSLEFLTYGVASWLMGVVADRFGLRLTLALGGAVMGGGCLLSSLSVGGWPIFLTWGVMIGFGVGSSYSPCAAAVSRWFVKSRGLAVGLVVSGLGLGTLIFPPICERLVVWLGWRWAAVCLGLAVWAVYGLAAWLVRQDPAALGLSPLGARPAPPDEAGQAADAEPARPAGLREAVGSRSFWLLFTIHGLWVLGMAMPMVHLVPFATDLGLDPAVAAAMLAVLGGMSVVGRVALSMVTERMGTARSLVILLLAQAGAMAWLASSGQAWQIWIFAVFYGFCYGGMASVFPLAAAELFGLKAMGSIFGLLIMGATIGGTVGPTLAGYIFDLTRAYFWAFMAGGLSMVLAALLPLGITKRG